MFNNYIVYVNYDNNNFNVSTSNNNVYLYEYKKIEDDTWEYVSSTNDSNDVSNDDIDTASIDEQLNDGLLEDVSSDVDMYIDIDDKEVVDDGEE